MPIRYWNRRRDREETELVYGDFGVRALYGNGLGFALTDRFLAGKFLSRIYGVYQDTERSARKIPDFISSFQIPMDDYESGPFRSFNEFFIRRFKPGKRPFPSVPQLMGAPAEARYLAYHSAESPLTMPIKGLRLDPLSVLGDLPDRERFRNGPCLLARLCPVDYHRFHFPDSGRIRHYHEERGKLHSVNPVALQRSPTLFLTNERQITVLDTDHFGQLAYVEVGALCVGKIVQSHALNQPYERGEEKGYFLFGASTVVVYGEAGKWEPEADLIRRTAEGIETLVELGSPVAKARAKK